MLYGLHTVAQARPAVVAFEVDLFRVVAANQVDVGQLPSAPPGLRQLSWLGPSILTATKPTNANEQFDTVQSALAGVPLAALPRYWRPFDSAQQAVAWRAARPLALTQPDPATADALVRAAMQSGLPLSQLRALPPLARQGEGTALLDDTGRVVAWLARPAAIAASTATH